MTRPVFHTFLIKVNNGKELRKKLALFITYVKGVTFSNESSKVGEQKGTL